MFENKTLTCKDCGAEFEFTAGEQEFFASKGFVNEPQRCKDCRNKRKEARRDGRTMHDAVCASCGAECQGPFLPNGERPVYCSECFAKIKAED